MVLSYSVIFFMFSTEASNSINPQDNLKNDLNLLLTQSCKSLAGIYQKIDERFHHKFHKLAQTVNGVIEQQKVLFEKLQQLAIERQKLNRVYQTSKLMGQQNDEYFKTAFEKLNAKHNKCALAFNKNEQLLVVLKKDLVIMQYHRQKAAASMESKLAVAIQNIRTKYKDVDQQTLENEILFTQTNFLFVQCNVDRLVPAVSNDNNTSSTNMNPSTAGSDQVVKKPDANIETDEATGDGQKLKKTWCSLFIAKNADTIQVEQEAKQHSIRRDAKQPRMGSGSGAI